jgi:hypothetical protein
MKAVVEPVDTSWERLSRQFVMSTFWAALIRVSILFAFRVPGK